MSGKKRFRQSLNGFNKEDVNVYMDRLVADFELKMDEKEDEIDILKNASKDIRKETELENGKIQSLQITINELEQKLKNEQYDTEKLRSLNLETRKEYEDKITRLEYEVEKSQNLNKPMTPEMEEKLREKEIEVEKIKKLLSQVEQKLIEKKYEIEKIEQELIEKEKEVGKTKKLLIEAEKKIVEKEYEIEKITNLNMGMKSDLAYRAEENEFGNMRNAVGIVNIDNEQALKEKEIEVEKLKQINEEIKKEIDTKLVEKEYELKEKEAKLVEKEDELGSIKSLNSEIMAKYEDAKNKINAVDSGKTQIADVLIRAEQAASEMIEKTKIDCQEQIKVAKYEVEKEKERLIQIKQEALEIVENAKIEAIIEKKKIQEEVAIGKKKLQEEAEVQEEKQNEIMARTKREVMVLANDEKRKIDELKKVARYEVELENIKLEDVKNQLRAIKLEAIGTIQKYNLELDGLIEDKKDDKVLYMRGESRIKT